MILLMLLTTTTLILKQAGNISYAETTEMPDAIDKLHFVEELEM